jgi:hypothetical protein
MVKGQHIVRILSALVTALGIPFCMRVLNLTALSSIAATLVVAIIAWITFARFDLTSITENLSSPEHRDNP